MLIRTVYIAVKQGFNDRQRLLRGNRTGTERRDLAFQHRVKRVNLCLIMPKIKQVVGVIHPVLP